MNTKIPRLLAFAALAAALALPTLAPAQEQPRSGGFLDGLFGGQSRQAPAAQPDAEMAVRINQLEAQIRQLTGTVEQLQFRNRQLEQQLQAAGVQPQAMAGPGAGAAPPAPPMQGQALPPPVGPGVRASGDAFDPARNPNAPGAPRTLGSSAALPRTLPPMQMPGNDEPVGAPGSREAGAPLDLSTLATGIPGAAQAAADPEQRVQPVPQQPGGGLLPPPPSRNPSATGRQLASVAPPSDTPKDQYDLGYGYLLRKDYALAEDALQTFLKKWPSDRLAADAQFWLGESLFQRQRYDGAAEAFLAVSTKHEKHPKAPEALLRLAQSLSQLKQKEMSCATLAEVGRKYPRAPGSVKQGVEREQKRVGC